MKPTKECDVQSKEFSKQLKEHFSDEEIACFVLSLLGMSDLAHRFIWEKVTEFMDLPVEVKYGLVQHASFYRLLSLVARDELEKEGHSTNFLPVDEYSWKSADDFEKRFVFVVKSFYKYLKEEGKL